MPQLLHPKHEAFCQAYARGPHAGNCQAAYVAAGYAPHHANAYRLAGRLHIKARIAELMEENAAIERGATRRAVEALALDRESVLRELKAIGFANMFDYLSVDDDERVHVDLARLAHAKGAPVSELTVEYGAADGEGKPVQRVRLRLHDKYGALVALARHLGLMPSRVRVGIDAMAPPDDPDLSDEEKQTRVIDGLVALTREGVDIPGLLARALEEAKARDAARVGVPRVPAIQ